MKQILALCLLVGLVLALPSTKIMDDGIPSSKPHRVLPATRGSIVLVDSSANSLSAWTKMQECLAFNPTLGGLEFVSRGYSPSGVLNVNQTDNTFSFWVSDQTVYNQQIPPANGGGRYPSAVASDGPHISFPTLDAGPAFGYAVAQWEEGGWYSSFWAEPVDLGPGNVGTHKNVGKQLDDGNILFVANDLTNNILYFTWSPDLSTEVASGVIASGVQYFGFDVNGGIAYVSYYDDALNVFYKTSTDGVNWSSEQSYNMQWALPYTNNTLYWTQMALTDAGDPLYVYDINDGDDATYPYDGIVGVSYAAGTPSVVVSQSGSQAFWGTIATGGDYAVVLYQVPWNSEPDSFAAHDQWFNWSSDNGVTWNTPVKITNSDEHTGLGQLAKRLDAANNNFFFFYGVDLVNEYDPFFMASVSSSDPHAWYVGWLEIPGVEEHEAKAPSKLALTVQNPVSARTRVTYTLTKSGEISLNLYDRTGSLVRTVETGQRDAGVYTLNLDTQNLANGTYFLRLNTTEGTASQSLVVIH